jgi:hypothetical protein
MAMSATLRWARPAQLGGLYAPPRTPVIVDVPPIAYLTRSGRGAPEASLAWAEAVDDLRTAWDAVRLYGPGSPAPQGIPGRVPPLEVVWADADPASWTVMLALAVDIDPAVEVPGVEIVRVHEGWCAQVLHLGGRRERDVSLSRLDRFVARQGYLRDAGLHEVFLDDPAAVSETVRRSILRRMVEPPG